MGADILTENQIIKNRSGNISILKREGEPRENAAENEEGRYKHHAGVDGRRPLLG